MCFGILQNMAEHYKNSVLDQCWKMVKHGKTCVPEHGGTCVWELGRTYNPEHGGPCDQEHSQKGQNMLIECISEKN